MSVSIVKCPSYDYDDVKLAVARIFDLQNVSRSEFENKKVLLKVNLVTLISVEKAATTNPAVVQAVVEKLKEFSPASIVIADSPGGPFMKAYLNQIYSTSKMKEVAEKTGAELNYDFSFEKVDVNGVSAKSLEIINAFQNADVVINLAKFKTHTLTGFSGATKNFYGLIPGLVKAQLHGANPDVNKFSDLLIDIQEYAKNKTVLHVTDAVVGMEGDGPTAGTPRKIGALIGSRSPYESDYSAIGIIKQTPDSIPYIKLALSRGLIDGKHEVNGDGVEPFVIEDYKKVELKTSIFPVVRHLPKGIQKYVNKNITRYPVISKNKCKKCGKCFTHCPPHAISMEKGYAEINYDKCIRCFCCQELCPFHVVKIKKPLLYRISHR